MHKIIEFPAKTIYENFNYEVGYPNNVFKKKFDNYFFLASEFVDCNDDFAIFSQKLHNLITATKEDIELGPIENKSSYWKAFYIKYNESNEGSYEDCLTYTDDTTLELRDCPFPVVIIPKSVNVEWSIYGEFVGTLSVVGVNSCLKDLLFSTFADLIILDRTELFELYQSAYKTENGEFNSLCENYGFSS